MVSSSTLPILVLLTLLPIFTYANNFGPPCLPERRNFKLFYPCLEGPREINFLKNRRFYNRLFYDLNSFPKGTRLAHVPNYGFNPNLPKDGPYAK